jgi:hypothetical protein
MHASINSTANKQDGNATNELVTPNDERKLEITSCMQGVDWGGRSVVVLRVGICWCLGRVCALIGATFLFNCLRYLWPVIRPAQAIESRMDE